MLIMLLDLRSTFFWVSEIARALTSLELAFAWARGVGTAVSTFHKVLAASLKLPFFERKFSGSRCVKNNLVILPEPLEETWFRPAPIVIAAQRHKIQNLRECSFSIDGAEQAVLKRVDRQNEIAEPVRRVYQHGHSPRR